MKIMDPHFSMKISVGKFEGFEEKKETEIFSNEFWHVTEMHEP